MIANSATVPAKVALVATAVAVASVVAVRQRVPVISVTAHVILVELPVKASATSVRVASTIALPVAAVKALQHPVHPVMTFQHRAVIQRHVVTLLPHGVISVPRAATSVPHVVTLPANQHSASPPALPSPVTGARYLCHVILHAGQRSQRVNSIS